MSSRLFPIDLPSREWVEFQAEGFSKPVSGVIYNSKEPPTCGVPLGGVSTGCLDLEATGTFGFSSIFNSHVPRRALPDLPFLAISIGGDTWFLARPKTRLHLPMFWADANAKQCLHNARRVHCWGHFPVVDLEFETRAPVSAGLRAWSPFLPGNTALSNIPAAIFEVRLRNASENPQKGTLAFSFRGPSREEGGPGNAQRQELAGESRGVVVSTQNASYALAAIGEERVRAGGELGLNGESWARIGKELPTPTDDTGASLAVDFSLAPGEEKTVRFVLAWFAPQWKSGGTPNSGGNTFTQMYATRYRNVNEVLEHVARDHASLLNRVLAWQQVIYGEEKLPPWLRDSLVNILHLITEDSFWGAAKPPIGDWCRPEDGLFGLIEDPRNCPQIECIPCSFYGNIPLVYFFPDLALSTLRGYKAYQYPDGAAPWVFGGTEDSPPCDLAVPSRGYQTVLNGPCYVDMADRYWLRTGDQDFLREFYPSIKKNTIFTMNLRPEYPPGDRLISMPTGNVGLEWFEACNWAGMTAHVGDIHLANIKMAERMAEKMGDKEFARQCHEWLQLGAQSMEKNLWTGKYYLNYLEPETNTKSDLIMSNQLDGEWMVRFHDLPNVLPSDRIATTLETVKRTGVAATRFGAVNFTLPDGTPASNAEGQPGWSYVDVACFTPEVLMLGMTYMYHGEKEFGLELCHGCWANLALAQGMTWDQPNIFRGDTGEQIYGGDYYQNLMLWSLPAALDGKGLSAPCEPGGLVDRIIKAAQA